MLKNYFKVALRNLWKNKTFSFINVFGLSLGLICCMLIALYIRYETSYDSYQRHIDDLYQLGTTFAKNGQSLEEMANTPAPMAQAMKQEFPEIAGVTRLLALFSEDKTLFQYSGNGGDKKSFYETKGYMADSSFFRLFSYDFIEDNSSIALNDPNTVVISDEIARKLFGKEPAENRIIRISSNTNGDHDFRVTGVFKPVISPSHIEGRFFMSMNGGDIEQYIKSHATDLATNNMFYTYLLLRPGSDYKKLESKFPAFMNKYAAADLKRMGFDKRQFLVPLRDIHLRPDITNNVTSPVSKTYLYILACIAIFTLLIACINFMNLSTARSSKRSAEVGVRKVLGADKGALVRQFLGESMLMTFIAFLIAVAAVYLFLPVFNGVSGKNIEFSLVQNNGMIFMFLVLALVTGFIAGSYPAFYLSSFRPVKVLKGRVTNSLAAVSFRKGLVVFQFVISVTLIVASVVIARQMTYLRNADLGFTKDEQLIIPLRSQNAKHIYNSLKNEIKSDSRVISVGASMYYPGIINPSDNVFYREGQTMNDAKRTRMNWVDYDFLQTLGIQPAAGRLFSASFPSDTNYSIIINEEAIKQIGFASTQDAVGKKILFDWQGTSYPFTIIGVVKDFHFEDLHLPITPYGFQLVNNTAAFNYMEVHATAGDLSGILRSIESSWDKLNPGEPFEYSFLDADFQKNYLAESRLAAIVSYFTIAAILISCLGLFGLATFSAEQRMKEIGIRKVLGASVTAIVGLLSKDFLKLVAIAILIASPIAWWATNKWLQDFAYRVNISWWIFGMAAVIALLIAWVTTSFHAIKAAMANPVKSLRTE